MTSIQPFSRSQSDLSFEKPTRTVNHSRVRVVHVADTSDTVLLVKRSGRFRARDDAQLLNNRPHVVGFLELANASDFAANVWNAVPVPIYATVLMAIGGTVALVLSVFAFKDTRRSWRNIRFLRNERRVLRDERRKHRKESELVHHLNSMLDVNCRELGCEMVCRCGMDVFMGCGAVLVGVGTLMAIGGANHNVWLASNLLSGYIGNVPLAVYGAVSLPWSICLWRRASQHLAIAKVALKDRPVPLNVLRRRTRNVQLYAVLNAITTTIGGAASLVTATMWQGYVALAPIIVLSMFCNSWWRRKIGYDRPSFDMALDLADHALLADKIEYAVSASDLIKLHATVGFDSFGIDSNSLSSVLKFVVANGLFKALCLEITNDANISAALVSASDSEEVKIKAADLLCVPKVLHPAIIQLAGKCLQAAGLRHFSYRQSYLAETLGSALRQEKRRGALLEKNLA